MTLKTYQMATAVMKVAKLVMALMIQAVFPVLLVIF